MGLPVRIDPTIWAAAGIAVGGFLFYRGFGLLRRQRLILNTPRSTVRGAALGTVEVSGKAVGPYTLISPLSALTCYYYRAVVWQNQARRWRKAAEEILYAPLFIDDGTGQLLIDPHGAEMDISMPFSHEYDSAFSAEFIPDYIAHFLHRHGISGDRRLKLEEQCILPGDAIFVLGTLLGNPRAGDRDGAPPASSRGLIPNFVSQEAADLQCRGILESLDPAAREALATAPETANPQAFDLRPETVLSQAAPRDPFFISWCSQREVVLTTAWKAFLYIWVGPILTLACLWLIVSQPR